ncbi:ABC transporter domain-containing protein [Meloidogyne graminicola]|uniref:ABC transporter domain-containing protein n=1 Tax=Meloidogyne graminicola TaxID=189291 RepID=A0A8T0A080_9BILA|nr:ABC transporter domain-containing protein [Meloidogyne graminicola]
MNTQVYDNYGARSSSSSSSSNIPEMESILNLGETENERNLRIINTRRKQVSLCSVAPSFVLSWHSITAKPRHEKSLFPSLFSNIYSKFTGSFDDIENGISSSLGKKYILNNVYGVAYPGEVLALMGAMVLALRKISAYVQQEDLFIGSMTVVEHLRFMAIMRMGKHYSAKERERRVQGVMAELGLKNCANTIIGWPNRLKGLSGGERKRLAFASEIMTGPPILFCDEPTSGLDSYLAKQVIQVLKDLARRKNMTIIVTIHQPSSQLFEMFDKICLLAEGKLAFLGTTSEAIPFFESLGYTLPENFNPADFFIGILADAAKSKGSRRRIYSKINKICSAFIKSDTGKQLMIELSSNGSEGSSPPINNKQNIVLNNNLNENNEGIQIFDISTDESISSSTPEYVEEVMEENEEKNENFFPLFMTTTITSNKEISKLELNKSSKEMQRYKSTWLQQFFALTRRSFFITIREPMLLKVRLFQTLLISLILGIIYFQTPIRQTTIMNINGLIFQSVANMNFMFQFGAAHIFCDELPIFMREHLSNLYRVDTYFLAKNIAELFQYIIYPLIFSSIVYWMSGFVHNILAYSSFVLSCICVTNVAVSLSYASSCIFGTTDLAIAMLPVVVIPLLAFGGFYINQQSLPSYFYPIKFISYFGYAYESAAISQWTRIDSIPGCNNQTLFNNLTEYNTCYMTGMDVLDSLGFEPKNISFDYTALFSMILDFYI